LICGGGKFFGFAGFDNNAIGEHGDAIGKLEHLRNVVADNHPGEPKLLVHPSNQFVNAFSKQRVQTGGRLVEQHNFGLGHEGAGQSGAFFHAAAHFRRKLVAHSGEAHLREAVIGFLLDVLFLELGFLA